MSFNRIYYCVYIFSFLVGTDYPNDRTLEFSWLYFLRNKSAHTLFLISSKKLFPAVSFLSTAGFSLFVMFLRNLLLTNRPCVPSLGNRKNEIPFICAGAKLFYGIYVFYGKDIATKVKLRTYLREH